VEVLIELGCGGLVDEPALRLKYVGVLDANMNRGQRDEEVNRRLTL